ncbi:glycosyltransferase [Calothrix sp. PCC 7507]|uniref:glycosyltransferase family 8 protein n=1 Tax=Calothrix sp. PCC 7507 TaxID=99598 RepID=UPI00029F4A5D|nr:glycosyltransferase [Calothrix sp. PCC 7507]AFY35623.1 glycosyl transferase family 8 [Calothrix sp. PCC 7507]
MNEQVRVYVGTDTSQLLAVKVLEHSIKRCTKLDVTVYPMLDLPIKKPQNPNNWQRTGFSFSRFCIPELAGYTGKALYLDADMLVFQDIASLWNIPFDGAKVVIQEDIPNEYQKTNKKLGAPSQRIKQCSVMLLDCTRLNWKIETIIDELDQDKYNYEQLMYELCILNESSDIKYSIPFKWNSLEHYDQHTCLIHYTDMATQPWASCQNKYAYLWFNELRLMLQDGSLKLEEIIQEINLGHFRPSLIRELKYGQFIPPFLESYFRKTNELLDKKSGFKPHQEVYKFKKIRQQAIREYKTSNSVS